MQRQVETSGVTCTNGLAGGESGTAKDCGCRAEDRLYTVYGHSWARAKACRRNIFDSSARIWTKQQDMGRHGTVSASSFVGQGQLSAFSLFVRGCCLLLIQDQPGRLAGGKAQASP